MLLCLIICFCRCVLTPHPSGGSPDIPVWMWSPAKKHHTVTASSMAANQAWQLLQQTYVYEKKIINPQSWQCYKLTHPICVYSLVPPVVEFDQINISFFIVLVFYSIFPALFGCLITSSLLLISPFFSHAH